MVTYEHVTIFNCGNDLLVGEATLTTTDDERGGLTFSLQAIGNEQLNLSSQAVYRIEAPPKPPRYVRADRNAQFGATVYVQLVPKP